jgi:hypothetical protein
LKKNSFKCFKTVEINVISNAFLQIISNTMNIKYLSKIELKMRSSIRVFCFSIMTENGISYFFCVFEWLPKTSE